MLIAGFRISKIKNQQSAILYSIAEIPIELSAQ